MGALKCLAAGLALFTASPCRGQGAERWRVHVEEASARFGLPARWIERVIAAESGGRTRLEGRPITSRAGAMGLMQLMPATWGEMRARLGLGNDPHRPRDNILAGSLYLRLMYDRFGYPGLFGAYNAGPRRYEEYLAKGCPLPAETRAYLAALSAAPEPAVTAAPHGAVDAIFFALGAEERGTEDAQVPPELFVRLRGAAPRRQAGN